MAHTPRMASATMGVTIFRWQRWSRMARDAARVGGRLMPELTYTQMHKVLHALGFTVRVVTEKKKLRVYEHPQTGAKLALAFRPDDEAVLPHHLAAVRGTLKVYGITDPFDVAAQPQ